MIPIHDDNPTRRRPYLTLALIAANIIVFVFVQPRSDPGDDARFTYQHAAIPCEVRQGSPITFQELETRDCDEDRGPRPFPGKDVLLAVLISMFLHGSWLHLLGNMLFLWIFGNNVEDHLGPIPFAFFYVITGIAAMGAHYLADPGSTTPVIGASGAIAGVMGAYLILWPRARILTIFLFFVFVPFYLPARVYLLFWLVFQFFTDPNSGVAWVAHLGGFAAGVALALIVRRAFGPPAQGDRALSPA